MSLGLVDAPMSIDIQRSLLDESTTLPGALEVLVERYPDFRCLIIVDHHGNERRITLAQLWDRALIVRNALVERGVRSGDVVVVILPTGTELLSVYFGIMLAGAAPALIATPSNRLSDHGFYADRVGAILDNARARILYCSGDVATILRGADAAILSGAELLTPDDVSGAAPTVASVMPSDPEAMATLQYSSGSTGTPKGVQLSHRAILNNIRYTRDGLDLQPTDVSVNWIPLYHDMGLIDAFLLPLLTGSPAVLIPTMEFMADPSLWLWAIHRYGGTLSFAPNFGYSVCASRLKASELEGLDLSGWRLSVTASEPILAHTILAFMERYAAYGFRPEALTAGWGLAESVTVATCHPASEPPRIEIIDRTALVAEGVARPTEDGDGVASFATGQCLPNCEIEIRDAETRSPLPDRHVGRIWLRTNALFSGYYNDPEATAAVMDEAGWFDTGDDGYMAAGDLYFVSRAKDLIVIGGNKYAPQDIETLINEVDGVRTGCAASFGVMNQRRGTEEIAAVIETRETDPERMRLIEREAKKRVLHAIGLPLRHVLVVPPGGVEKTSSGKLARNATRIRYTDRLPG